MIVLNSETPIKHNSFETCYKGMNSIFNNGVNQELVGDKVIKDLKDKVFKIDRIHLVKVKDSYSCDVFTRDSKGVRRYSVSLGKSLKYAHDYKIISVKEEKVNLRYQL